MKQQQERQSTFQKQQLLLLQTQKYTTLIKKIQNIQISNSADFVKILGIYFKNNLQITSNYNWELLYQS